MIQIQNSEIFDTVVSNAIQSAVTNSKTNQTAQRWTRAIERAVTEIHENPFLHYDEAENHLLVVSSTSNNLYSANGVCQCKAFIEFSLPCWHRAAARIVRLYTEAVNQPQTVVRIKTNGGVDIPYLRNTGVVKAERIGGIRIN